ncbi:unnamed protein product [Microthlaspi erraticum]|uniref:Phorbol-ester/DAG-type domain-containing protein n=1 Tax=Microthlaspi erraticum TaxID=1685480 RepID=A0A6D2IJ27_9BRAS|nr:unnamed protein product [Microthlaspi erraticum]
MDAPPRCPRSDPVHPHSLCRQDNPPLRECCWCGPDAQEFVDGGWHYSCDICDLVFHDDCNIFLPGIRHPYHLNHFLYLTFEYADMEFKPCRNQDEFNEAHNKLQSASPESLKSCDWCGKDLGVLYYRCLVCGFSLDDSCIKEDPLFTITNPKSHQHSLTLFPRPLLVRCSACGLGDHKQDPGYLCLPCNYVVHKTCIDLPRVIKLTRHPHRLSYIPYLPPPAKRSCGVCRRNVDVKHGMFSCNKGCSYAIHSKCATHKDIWDGIDLEDVPEEPLEDLAPFEEVGYNLIKHFSHEHPLKLDAEGLAHDGSKECQACCRPVELDGFYSCTILDCDFFLHAPCANFPKKKEHPVHKHPLMLQPAERNDRNCCLACTRVYTGFSYACFQSSCTYNDDDSEDDDSIFKEMFDDDDNIFNIFQDDDDDEDIDKDDDNDHIFRMDVRCASVSEPFEHKVHPHPLFLFSGRDSSSTCGICRERGKSIFTLTCNDCKYIMCFKCATIPVVIRYKHDEHLLTLSGGEDSSDPYWCEKCERKIDPKKWFYTCDKCCTTLHIDCLFGDSSYIKLGWSMDVGDDDDDDDDGLIFISNNGNSRPTCDQCGVRCQSRGYFTVEDVCLCSIKCMSNFSE